MAEPKTLHASAHQLVIRPYRARAVAYLVVALLSLSPVAFGRFWFLHYTFTYALVSLCSFIPSTKLNRKDGTARQYHLIHFPIKRSLDEFKVVTISRSDKQGACYRVCLECPSDPLLIVETNDYSDAREYSESAATYLGINIRDDALGRTTFHQRQPSDSDTATESPSRKAPTELSQLDRTTALMGLDTNEILEIRRKIGFEVYLGTAWLSMISICGFLFLPPMQGAGWMVQVMQAFFALLLAVSLWNFLRHRGGTLLVHDFPYLFTWKALRLRPLMRIRAIAEFDRVTLSYEHRINEKGKRTPFHCIRLDGESVPVTLVEIEDDARAAKTAAQVSGFLSLPVDDFMKQDPMKTSLRTKIRATDSDWNITPPPTGISIDYERRGDEFLFKVPARGYGLWKLPLIAGIFFPVITIGFLAIIAAVNWQPPQWVQTTVWVVCIASWALYLPLLLAIILPFMRILSRREQIHVSPQSLRVQSRALDNRTDLTLPAGELTDVTIGRPTAKHLTEDTGGIFAPHKVIRVCGTVHTLEFGGNLTQEELTWLRKAIVGILLADQPPED